MALKSEFPSTQRFFGPVNKSEADAIADEILDVHALPEILSQLASGEIEPREAIYEIQLLMEVIQASHNDSREGEYPYGMAPKEYA